MPTYGIIDSQTVKTAGKGEAHGIDGGKKIKGRKRHIVVDIMGNLLAVYVHSANLHDTVMGIMPAIRACSLYPSIQKFCGDQGYRKTFEEDAASFLGIEVEISEKITPNKFHILPKRWVVERTLSWLNNSRRLSKDYETSTNSSENMIKISHSRTLLKRLLCMNTASKPGQIIRDTYDGQQYMVVTELAHNTIHPLLRYIVEGVVNN